MSAYKKSAYALFSMALAVGCLLAVFAVMDASSARAGQREVTQPASNDLQPAIVVSPTELQATLNPDELLTQTLWITNSGDSPLTYTIYELSAPVRLAGFTVLPASIPVVDTEAQSQVTAQGRASLIIYLREQPDLSPAYAIPDRIARVQYVYDRMLETASHSQELYSWLESQGTAPRRLLIANAIVATLDETQLATLSENPQVRTITPNRQYQIIPDIPTPLVGPPVPTVSSARTETVEWNIAKIHADDAWSTFGVTGNGAVVGVIDTGVLYNHPALVNSYRGNLGGSFDHNYNWVDFVMGNTVPYDDNGHGTMITGIVSGDDGGTNQIGVAPGANWIAAKVCTAGGSCDDAAILAAFQWMIAPTDLNGQNPDPAKAPQVVFGGWGGQGCSSFFEPYLSALRSAGILPIFSSGGGGPSCGSMGSPADSSQVLAAGATDSNDLIATFSPRGPSCYGQIKPDVTAPGVNVRSSFPPNDYQVWSGTAESSAHLAGVVALIISANPTLGANDVTDILFTTSLCIENLSCPPSDPCPGANNVYGHGRIDAYEAVYAALGYPPQVNLPWLSEAPISGTLDAGEGVAVQVSFDSTGLAEGAYNGALGILSSDPVQPFFSVPVTMNVVLPTGPVIMFNWQSFFETLPVGGMLTDTLTISNAGDAMLTFTLYEVSATHMLMSPPVEFSIPEPTPNVGPVQVEASVNTQLIFLGHARLILYLRNQPDLSAAYAIPDRARRVQYVYDRLLETATLSDDLYNWLVIQGAEPRRLLATNAIAATLDEAQLDTVLGFPQVGRVGVNGQVEILQNSPANGVWQQSPISLPDTIEWNIAQIGADQVWSTFGIRGEGVVIGVVDTGVAYTHLALNAQYRGNLGGGNYDHNYNWYDLVNGNPMPYDDNNHGTFGTGIAVGDDGGDNQIGVAPGAQWIAVKALDANGNGSYENLHAALAWVIAPTDVYGENPDPSLAPQVVLNMWSISSFNCDHAFDADLVALRAANILPVFSPGAEGPGCGTVGTPAADPNAFSAGATDNNDVIASFSANGPSCYDGTTIKPDLVAPGVNVRSSTANGSYQVWSGTASSAAHLAGASALLFSADPGISLDDLEQTLFDTAVCHEQLACGGDPCPLPNNTYGYGRIDVFQAVSSTLAPPYDIPWLVAGPFSGELAPGQSVDIPVIFNASGMQPGSYQGGIAVGSNDPLVPFTILPVDLTVVDFYRIVLPIINK